MITVKKSDGSVVELDQLIDAIIEKKLLKESSIDPIQAALASKVIDRLYESDMHPTIGALLILNPDLMRTLSALVYLGIQVNSIFSLNDFILEVPDASNSDIISRGGSG